MSFQDELNSLGLWIAGCVARSLPIALDMRLARALPAIQIPARLKLIGMSWFQTDPLPSRHSGGRMMAMTADDAFKYFLATALICSSVTAS
jgi:hypothetical protein